MRRKDFEKLIDQYVNCNGLYYKILEPIKYNGKVIGARTHLLCSAKHSNACTNYYHCGFFFRECNLFYCDIDEYMKVVTREEVVQYIKQITKRVIKEFL